MIELIPFESEVEKQLKEIIKKEDLIRVVLAHSYWSCRLNKKIGLLDENNVVFIEIALYQPLTNIEMINLYLEESDLERLKKRLPKEMMITDGIKKSKLNLLLLKIRNQIKNYFVAKREKV